MAKDPYAYFRVEAHEIVAGLTQGLLGLEKDGAQPEAVARILRLTHTLKGAARVVRCGAIAESAHALEERLSPFRTGAAPGARPPVGELLALVDAIKAELATLGPAPVAAEPARAGAAAPPEEEGFATVRVPVAEVDALLNGIAELGARLYGLRGCASAIDDARKLAVGLGGELARAKAAGLAPARPLRRAEEMATGLAEEIARIGRSLSNTLEQTEREAADTRERSAELRLMPAAALFPELERAARDAALAQGRTVRFATVGGQSRLDTHVLAGLRGALLHLVRNAVVHGIEAPAARVAAGKPSAGEVRLAIVRRGNRVTITCADDGRGFDLPAIGQVARRRGLTAAANVKDALEMVIAHGLSTSATVTELAGRGLGLGAVEETVVKLKGELEVESDPGRGTRVHITVPVSLASLAALAVEAAGLTTLVPLDAVRETLRIRETDIAHSPEGESIAHAGAAIPLLRLRGVLGATAEAADLAPGAHSAVVLAAGGRSAALIVERLVGVTQVVVRALPALAGADDVVGGAALGPDGDPVLVLEPSRLVDAARATAAPAREVAQRRRAPVLVIDDSLTTRMLEQSILEAAGYDVEIAASAEEALVKAEKHRYELFLVDVEMPGMSGFEFLERTRGDPELGKVPAILVTSRASPEDRRRGERAGARAYIVKSEFDQVELLRTIDELTGAVS